MKLRVNLLFLILGCFIFTINAQSLSLLLPEKEVNEDELFDLSIDVKDFDQLVSIQFSIVWDPAVMQYVSNDIMDLENVAIGDAKASDGVLRFSWFDIAGEGVTLDALKKIIKFHFKAVGNIGDMSLIEITSNPLPLQIYKGTSSDYKPIAASITNGRVEIKDNFSFEVFVSDLLCNGDQNGSISLNVPNEDDFSYSWSGNEFIFNGKDIKNLGAGSYHLIVLDKNNEVVLDTVFEITEPEPLIIERVQTVSGDCEGNKGNAEITVSGGVAPYFYDLGQGNITSNIFSELEAGDYEVSITDGNGCKDTKTFSIDKLGAPIVSLGENRKICEGSSLIVEGDYSSFSWSTGDDGSSLIPTETGLYSVTVTNESGCTASDEVLVSLLEGALAILDTEETSVCLGDSIRLKASGGDWYYWLDKYGFLSDTSVIDPVATPRFSAPIGLVAGNDCNADTLLFNLEVYDVIATAGQDTCIRAGDHINLNASGGVQYFWVDYGSALSDDGIPNPETRPLENANYVVTILDENDCISIDTVTITVDCSPTEKLIAINTITPNGDGKNDVLKFNGLAAFSPNQLLVFNRWGKIVYESIDYHLTENPFDGTFEGKPLPAGTYYYVLSVDGQEIKQALSIIND